MELATEEERVVGKLHDLDVRSVRGGAADTETGRSERAFVFSVELVAMAMALADLALPVGWRAPAFQVPACRSMRPGASCRRVPPRRVIRATCKSRDAALPDRTRWSSPAPTRTRCAQTRYTRSACPGRSQSTEPCSRAHIECPSASPQCRACRSRPAPECRRHVPAAPARWHLSVPGLRLQSSSLPASDYGRERRVPKPLSEICTSLRTRRICRRYRS